MKKRKACISTFFGTENYGSNLQAIGLYRTLEKMGFDVYMFDRFRVKSFLLRHPVLIYARVINKLGEKQNKAFFNPSPYKKSEERLGRLKKFKEENFKVISFDNDREWKKAIASRTVFVAGGDIVWNPAKGYPAKYFLDVPYYAKLPRFSFGSSIGALELPKKYYRAYRRYLSSMQGVGVREQSVVQMLEPIIHRRVSQVVDPSILLSYEEWDRFADKAEISVPVDKAGYVLCYFVMEDPRYWEYVKQIRMTMGLQIIVLPMHKSDEIQPYDIILDGTTYEFVWLIKNAALVCTDSFHACVFSAIFSKEFYLLPRVRKAENAKYKDFLSRYNLCDRLVKDESVFVRDVDIDFEYVRKQMEFDKTESIRFLKNTIRICK